MKRAFQNAGLMLGSIILGLFLIEILVRLFMPQQLILVRPDIWMPDGVSGWRRCANVDTRVNWGEKTVRLVTDPEGFRIDKPSGRVRGTADFSILMVGDSFLEALQVENENTIPRLIEDLLEERYSMTARVDNSSAGGWGPENYLAEVNRALRKRHYDLVIVFIYPSNDMIVKRADSLEIRAPTITHALRLPHSFRPREWVDGVLYPINDVLEARSHLFVLLKKKAINLRAKFGLTPYYFPDVFKASESKSPMWDVTTAVFRSIRDECSLHQTPAVFVLLPTSYQVDEKKFSDYLRWFKIDPATVDLEQSSRELGARFARDGLSLLDPLATLRSRQRDGVESYGAVDTHFKESGHRVVAEFLFPTVETYLPARLQRRAALR